LLLEIGLLWCFLVLWLLIWAGMIALEMQKTPYSVEVLLVFLQNNEENAEALLREICRKAKYCNNEIHLLIIDNCSTDQTVPIITRLKHYCPPIDILDRSDAKSLTAKQLELLSGNDLRVLDFSGVSYWTVKNPFLPEIPPVSLLV